MGAVNRDGEAPPTEMLMRLSSGQTPEDLQRQSAELAQAHGAARAEVRADRPGWARIRYYDREPLADAPPVVPPVDASSDHGPDRLGG